MCSPPIVPPGAWRRRFARDSTTVAPWTAASSRMMVLKTSGARKRRASRSRAAAAIGKAFSQQRDRQALRRNEERFRQLLKNSSDVTSILGPQGTIRYHSPSLQHVLGCEPGDLQGRSVFDYVHTSDRAPLEVHFGQLAQTPGATVTVAFRWRHAAGR